MRTLFLMLLHIALHGEPFLAVATHVLKEMVQLWVQFLGNKSQDIHITISGTDYHLLRRQLLLDALFPCDISVPFWT